MRLIFSYVTKTGLYIWQYIDLRETRRCRKKRSESASWGMDALSLWCVKAMGDGDYQFLMRMIVVVMNERSESQVEIWRMLLPLLVDWLLLTSLGWT